jgi:hypothetical protein
MFRSKDKDHVPVEDEKHAEDRSSERPLSGSGAK